VKKRKILPLPQEFEDEIRMILIVQLRADEILKIFAAFGAESFILPYLI
jgi:hypothetical protein